MSDNPFNIPVDEILSIYKDIAPALEDYCQSNSLDSGIFDRLQSIYIPLACWINQQQQPVVIGISGALGTGKSTLAGLLAAILELGFNKRVLNLSIDDLYYSKQERLKLAEEVHPLLATRGVPGTHNVETGIRILEQCLSGESRKVKVPVFDKSIDDLKPKDEWPVKQLPVDIVLLEGWCVGVKPQADEELLEPVNQLEKEEDPEGIWRNYVNEQLKGDYQQLFNLIDKLIMMKVPSMEQVMQWRNLQEDKLCKTSCVSGNQSALMDKQQIARFILHDERIMQHQLSEMPGRADVILEIGEDHQIHNIKVR